MEEWKEYKLGEIAEFRTGKLNSNAAVHNGKYPFFTCAPDNYYINDYAFDQKAILLAGNNAEGNFNIKYYEGKFNAYQRTYIINPVSDAIDIHFLYYALQLCLQQFKSLAQGTSTKFLTAKILNAFCIQVPLLSIQKRIADVIKSIDDKIEVNRRINDNLEQQAQALFKSWFVDFEPFKDQPFVESELGMIPQGWRVGTLGEIIKEIESGSRPKGGAETNGIPSIGAEKIERFGIYDYSGEKFINNDFYTNMKRGHVEDGDVLLYKDGAYTGKSSMALDGFPYCECAVNEHVFLLRTESSKSQFFLYYLISYPEIKTMIHTLASSKAAQPGLNQKELLGLDIIIPDEDTVKLFNNLVSPSMHQIATNSKQTRRLAELRDTLLPRLMSGQINVR
jgi:type I restriction enzyme S subunit